MTTAAALSDTALRVAEGFGVEVKAVSITFNLDPSRPEAPVTWTVSVRSKHPDGRRKLESVTDGIGDTLDEAAATVLSRRAFHHVR